MNAATLNGESIPCVTTDQMREVDRLMIEEFGIGLPLMMENAGANLGELVVAMLEGSVLNKNVVIASGNGNNGGGNGRGGGKKGG